MSDTKKWFWGNLSKLNAFTKSILDGVIDPATDPARSIIKYLGPAINNYPRGTNKKRVHKQQDLFEAATDRKSVV